MINTSTSFVPLLHPLLCRKSPGKALTLGFEDASCSVHSSVTKSAQGSGRPRWRSHVPSPEHSSIVQKIEKVKAGSFSSEAWSQYRIDESSTKENHRKDFGDFRAAIQHSTTLSKARPWYGIFICIANGTKIVTPKSLTDEWYLSATFHGFSFENWSAMCFNCPTSHWLARTSRFCWPKVPGRWQSRHTSSPWYQQLHIWQGAKGSLGGTTNL